MSDNQSDQIKVIDKRIKFFMVSNEIFNYDIDTYAFKIYCMLIAMASKNTCYPSINFISDKAKISKNKVLECIKSLEEKRLIKIEKSGGAWEYDENGRKEYRNAVNTYILVDIFEKKKEPIHNKCTPSAYCEKPSAYDSSDLAHEKSCNKTSEDKTKREKEEIFSPHDLTQEEKDAIMDEYREEHDLNAPNEPVEPEYEDFKASLVKTYASMTGKPVSELYQVWGFSNIQKYAEKERGLSIVFKQRRYDWKQCLSSAKNHKDIVNKIGSEKWSKFLDILYDFLANGGYGIDSIYKKPIQPEKTHEEMIAEHKKMCAEIFDLKAIFGDEDV